MIINQTNQNIQPFEDMVKIVDNHHYPLLKQQEFVYRAKSKQIQAPYFNNLGDLQQTLDVYVVDMNSMPCKELTILDINRHINSLKKELDKLKKALEINPEQEELRRKYERINELLTSLQNKLNSPNSNGSITLNITIKGLYRRNSNGKGEILIGYNRWDTTDMVLTYIHEMMHAYFDASLLAQPHVEYAEEPLAELGKLHFCEDFDKSHYNFTLYQAARQNVQSKQDTLGMGHYGFGLYLKDNYNKVPWENIFRANHHLLLHNNLYQVLELSLAVYPFEEAEAHRLSNLLLEYILNPGSSAIPVAIPNAASRRRIVYPDPSYFDNNRLSNGNIERPNVINHDVVKYLVEQIPVEYLENKNSTFFDPFEKDSPFLEEIAARLMTTMQAYFPNEAEREKHIRKNMLFGYDGKDSITFLSDNMTTAEKQLWSKHYSVIIGIPPFYYRTGTTKTCLYLSVVEKILHLCRTDEMMFFLIPTNWYMSQDNSCTYQRERIFQNIKALFDFYKTKDVFPQENFLGGVAAIQLSNMHNSNYYYYTEIPSFPYYYKSECREKENDYIRREIFYNTYIRRGIIYNTIYHKIRNKSWSLWEYNNDISLEKGGYNSWSIKNARHASKGYIIQHHTPGQAVPPSNYVVYFDPKIFNPQAVEKFFQTKLARYLVYHECPTTSWGIPKHAFYILPVECLLQPTSTNPYAPTINWSFPIDQIENILYQYYELNQSEIDIINHEID